MPEPITIALTAAKLAPFVFSLFAGGPERLDPQKTLRKLIAEFERALGPAGDAVVDSASQARAIAGAQLRQDFASASGKVGGGSTGTGRVRRGLGVTASGVQGTQAAANARLQVAQTITSLATQALPSALNGQTQTKPSTGIQNFLQGLGGVTAADGRNPIEAVLERILKDSKPGESPVSVADFQKIMESPLLQPQGPGTRNFGNEGAGLFFGPPEARTRGGR